MMMLWIAIGSIGFILVVGSAFRIRRLILITQGLNKKEEFIKYLKEMDLMLFIVLSLIALFGFIIGLDYILSNYPILKETNLHSLILLFFAVIAWKTFRVNFLSLVKFPWKRILFLLAIASVMFFINIALISQKQIKEFVSNIIGIGWFIAIIYPYFVKKICSNEHKEDS